MKVNDEDITIAAAQRRFSTAVLVVITAHISPTPLFGFLLLGTALSVYLLLELLGIDDQRPRQHVILYKRD